MKVPGFAPRAITGMHYFNTPAVVTFILSSSCAVDLSIVMGRIHCNAGEFSKIEAVGVYDFTTETVVLPDEIVVPVCSIYVD